MWGSLDRSMKQLLGSKICFDDSLSILVAIAGEQMLVLDLE